MNDESNTRYNQVRQKGSHNSYQRTEGLDDQAIYWRLRALELDIHNGKGCSGRPPLDGDWYIYHYCGPGGTGTTVDTLSSALDELVGFVAAVPDHEVMTLFLDLKDDFDDTHTPEDLDALLAAKLGAKNLWGPPDLIAASGAATLQAAVGAVGWPVLEALRGKFIVALTGGDVAKPGTKLNQYVDDGKSANERLAFVAPEITAAGQIDAADYVVFFNLDSSHRDLGPAIHDRGFVGRTYTLNNAADWDDAVALEINHLATDKVNSEVDPWSRTDNAHGWPFEGIDLEMDPALTEPGLIYGLEVTSGDIWGSADSFYFVYDQRSGADLDRTYEVFISSPASHVQAWAKGAVLARASLDAGAPYFGVFRTGTKDLRVQYRTAQGGSTKAVEVDIVPPDTVDENNLIFVRLEITNAGRHAKAWGSLNTGSWTPIAELDFATALAFQGWGASSHGQAAVKFLFGNADGSPAAFSSQQPIGSGAAGTFFEGIYPPANG